MLQFCTAHISSFVCPSNQLVTTSIINTTFLILVYKCVLYLYFVPLIGQNQYLTTKTI